MINSLRAIATKNRVITFSEKESLYAFLQSLTVKDFNVHSIEDWYNMTKEDVNALCQLIRRKTRIKFNRKRFFNIGGFYSI